MPLKSTVGQLLVNDALPKEYHDHGRTLGKDELDTILADIAEKHPSEYRTISAQLMRLGANHAFDPSATIRLSDLIPKFDKQPILAEVAAQEAKIKATPN